jgi:hypothetical protein
MRTDERAGQAAKHKLKFLEDKLYRDKSLHPDSAAPHLSPEQRLKIRDDIALLRDVCGCN